MTIPEYRREYGPSYRGESKLDLPATTCPACHQELLIRGAHGPQDRQTFAHFPVSPDRPDVFCTIKLAGRHKYSVLCPVDHDPALAKKLRTSFFKNWKVHWSRFKQYIGHVDVDDFIAVLKVADKANVWGYRAMKEHEVIIALMLISDFKPVLALRPARVQSQQVAISESVATPTTEAEARPQPKPEPWRKNWIRFWFESRARSFDDFWNLSLENKVIIRVEYAVPEGETKLDPDYLDSFKVIDVSYDYLAHRKPGDDTVASVVESRMKRAFKKDIEDK
ncbi:hypothetical protein ACIOMR_04730 [Pseudomonas sp. NPDC087814]|uniref:hypothetical protein n=1 Tax=Pseudomonas TaxID=286 RepID=UPI0015E3A547|nr:hypothetical protein [Pseudomonas carnis]MBA1302410.1 hypothetical protein [Pseudomonas carnis]MBJ2204368.1 hypothetical protein [Pseudomonas carnis]